MIKLASFALMPAVLAAFYAHQEPQPLSVDGRRAQVEEMDRKFLASLSPESVSSGSADRADREFLARLQAEEFRAAHREMPVLRAIPIERTMPVARVSAPVVMRDLPTEMPEVRRAVAVVRGPALASNQPDARLASTVATSSAENLRSTLQEPYSTLGAREIRRSAGEGRRAAIVIYGDQVVLR